MKATIEDLQDTFTYGYDVYKTSREEADEVWNLYHNRHFTPAQLSVLENRGQPAETFNVVKMYARMLVGYYSTVVNTAIVNPVHYDDITVASLLNDVVSHTFKANRYDSVEGDKVKLSGMISGLLVSYVDVVDTGKRDNYNRPINKVTLSHVPDSEIVLDPASTADDYSDASFLHRFKWVSEAIVVKLFGKAKLKELDAYYNHLNINESEFEYLYGERFVGKYKVHNNYLIVHSVIEDDKGERWSIYWSQDTILKKERITAKEVRWPYRVEKLHTSDKAEYYGMFREVKASQHALNQAVLKIQLMVNSTKVFVQNGAVENIAEFETAYNRVSGIIPTLQNSGIRVDQLAKEIQDQYIIIDRALDRIQKTLGINDSFLGMAYASDSGRKVKLQQSATIMSLRYVTARIESFYELLAYDVGNLAKQYYTATQLLRITDAVTGQRWVELNQPITEWSGKMNPDGSPELVPVLSPEVNPANPEEFLEDGEGNIVIGPVSRQETEFTFTEFEIDMQSSSYNDEDEKAQLLLETFMSGAIGQMTMQANPAGFFKMAALSIKSVHTKYSPNIVEVLEQTAQMLGGNPEQNQQLAEANQGRSGSTSQPKSATLKLPQNTQGAM